jgi:hypothetical protein
MCANFNDKIAQWFDGCTISTATTTNYLQAIYRLVANKLKRLGTGTNTYPSYQLQTGVWDPALIEFNQINSVDVTTNYGLSLGGGTYNQNIGISIVGNVIEATAGSGPLLWIAADENYSTVNHTIVWHNTIVGERVNFLYNSVGTAPALMTNTTGKFNSYWQICQKDDIFTGDGGASGNRIGNWSIEYGCGFEGNSEQTNGLTFGTEFPGIGCPTMPTSPVDQTHPGTPNYTLDASITGTAAGGGNYLPKPGSSLIGLVGAGRGVVLGDLYGNLVSNSGGFAGAIQAAAYVLIQSYLSAGYSSYSRHH